MAALFDCEGIEGGDICFDGLGCYHIRNKIRSFNFGILGNNNGFG